MSYTMGVVREVLTGRECMRLAEYYSAPVPWHRRQEFVRDGVTKFYGKDPRSDNNEKVHVTIRKCLT